MNGMIRRFYPKRTNFNKVSDEELHSVMDQINNLKREKLNRNSSIDLYAKEVSKIK